MCGIVAVFVPGGAPVIHVQRMTDAMRHRGPDDEGFLLVHGQDIGRAAGPDTPQSVLDADTPWRPDSPPLADRAQQPCELVIAQRRLAIIDVSPGGHQPMRRGEHLWAVYNGEVFNYLELRAELEGLGHRFFSHSDTEVLLAAYQQWGPQGLTRCNGMWTLLLYDASRRVLFVARDRFGVKPLYCWQGPRGELMLASEVKALWQHPLVRAAARVDEAACVRFLEAGPDESAAETCFAGITRFPAGHWAELSLDRPGPLQCVPYWQFPDASPPPGRFDPQRAAALREQYLALLGDAVRLRLRADVRLGTALSGGLDSSSIATLVNEQLRLAGAQHQQHVFSSVYRDPRHAASDESRFIAQVAAQLDVCSHVIEPRWEDVAQEHERMVWALDTPPANTLMSSWHTFRLVAQNGVSVTLDGQGADEQLAGYARYATNHLLHLPLGGLVPEAWRIARTMPGFGPQVARAFGLRAVRALGGRRSAQALVDALRMGSHPTRTLDQALRGDFLGNLKTLLLYADKTAMAWSVESRMPFMDVRLVEFLAGVEPQYKLHAGWTKWLARDAMSDRLPTEVLWRRDKLGWAIPEQEWFGGPLGAWLDRRIGDSRFVQDLASRAAPRPGLAAKVRMLNLAVWHALFFEERDTPGRPLGRGVLQRRATT
jgi:asparagine synthase (glutamine-hydrolysing)